MNKGKKTNVVLEYFKGVNKNGKVYVYVKVFDAERNYLGSYFANGKIAERFN